MVAFSSRLSTHATVVLAETRKNLKLYLSYPIELFGFSFLPVLWMIPLLFQGKALAGGLRSPAFAALTGTDHYLAYVMVGSLVSTYVFSSLYGMGGSIREESYYGTLELLLGSPASRLAIMLGKALSDALVATVMMVLQGALYAAVLGARIPLEAWGLSLAAMASLAAGLYGLGLGLAGLTFRYKEIRGLTHTLNHLMFLVTPIRYPVEVSPFAHRVSVWIPVTYALAIIRGSGLLGRGAADLWPSFARLILLDVLFFLGGLGLFVALESSSKKSGVLGHY